MLGSPKSLSHYLSCLWVVSGGLSAFAQAQPVVLVSIDGLRPDYVLDASVHGLNVPNLRQMMTDGAYSTGVRGILPTVTYPSHTTLVTGVSPALHGICSNTTFDPEGRNQSGWYWYASDIRVPTLWDAAHQAGLITASVHWPVTVGAKIDFNLPQVWRAGTPDDRKLLRAVSTPGLLDELERALPPYADGEDESLEADQLRTKYAIRLFQIKHPRFMMLYLASLDSVEHEFGPFSKEATATLEQIDKLIGDLRSAVGPGSVLAVVSDHGFLPVTKEVNVLVEFHQAGLMEGLARWAAGASGAIMIRPQTPPDTKSRVAAVLDQLLKNPNSGVARVLNADDVQHLGGCPADFFVEMKPGFTFGSRATGALITATNTRGTHGYLADRREMNAAFFITGPGIDRRESLGEIDMRDIAPTLAALLHIELPTAEGHDLFAKRVQPK